MTESAYIQCVQTYWCSLEKPRRHSQISDYNVYILQHAQQCSKPELYDQNSYVIAELPALNAQYLPLIKAFRIICLYMFANVLSFRQINFRMITWESFNGWIKKSVTPKWIVLKVLPILHHVSVRNPYATSRGGGGKFAFPIVCKFCILRPRNIIVSNIMLILIPMYCTPA